MGKVVRVAQIPASKPRPVDADRVLEQLCYYYPQYTFAQARRLPYKRVASLLRTAHQLQAKHYHELTQISAAPHTEKGKGVTDLLKRYEDEARHG